MGGDGAVDGAWPREFQTPEAGRLWECPTDGCVRWVREPSRACCRQCRADPTVMTGAGRGGHHTSCDLRQMIRVLLADGGSNRS